MEISLGILAGGRGSRMGGRDKGLIVHRGQPLIGHLLNSQVHSFHETLVTCTHNHWLYGHYADRVLCDLTPHCGPVAGMAALLSANQSPLLAILPCDQRDLPVNWLTLLLAGLSDDSLGVYATEGGRHTPCCVLRKSALAPAGDCLAQECTALGQFYKHLGLTALDVPLSGRDVDTVDDLH